MCNLPFLGIEKLYNSFVQIQTTSHTQIFKLRIVT